MMNLRGWSELSMWKLTIYREGMPLSRNGFSCDSHPLSLPNAYMQRNQKPCKSLRHETTRLTYWNKCNWTTKCMLLTCCSVILSFQKLFSLLLARFLTWSKLVKMYLSARCKQRLIFTRSWLGKNPLWNSLSTDGFRVPLSWNV